MQFRTMRIGLMGLGFFAAVGCILLSDIAQAKELPGDVTALGRITPGRAVYRLAAPLGERVERLHQAEGAAVEAGDVLVTLASYAPRAAEEAAVRADLAERERAAEAEHALARAQVAAALAERELRAVELEQARAELARAMKSEAAATEQERDTRGFAVRAAESALVLAEAQVEAIKAGSKKALAALGVEMARQHVALAQAQLELSVVRAPIAGRVLKVHLYPGETTGNEAVIDLGDTDDMQVIAEVQADDVRRVRVGQRAVVTSPALAKELSGEVVEIGHLIYRNDVLGLDPRAPRDTRVLEVRVRLDEPALVERFSNLEVAVRILSSKGAQ